jgi:hypothetical protein
VKSTVDWKLEYKTEIEHGLNARSEGNEGMARVCARRAAGIIIGEYLQRKGYSILSKSAYHRLSLFISQPYIDQKYKDIAAHCLLKVNQDHHLPMKLDLLSEVIWLKNNLLMDIDE